MSVLWSHSFYCTEQNISALERIQRRATKYILNDYVSDYKTRLIKLNLLPLMYIYDQCDILFFIKSIQNPSDHFNIQTFIKFCHHSTRSSSSNKLEHVFTSSNQQRNFYFNRLPRTFNSLPVIDLTQPFVTIKFQLTKILWRHFIRNFDPDNQHIVSILHVLLASAPNIPSHLTLIHLAANCNYISNDKYLI